MRLDLKKQILSDSITHYEDIILWGQRENQAVKSRKIGEEKYLLRCHYLVGLVDSWLLLTAFFLSFFTEEIS